MPRNVTTRARPSLCGVRSKAARAREHLETLSAETDAFGKDEPVRLVSSFDRDTATHVVNAKIREPDQPRWGLLLGDFAQNARAALDHLVWQLVLLSGNTPGLENAFPIATTCTAYRGSPEGRRMSLRERGLKGVDDNYRPAIDAVQPYLLAEDPASHPLAGLQWLSNIDKHRVIHAAAVAARRPDVTTFAVSSPTGGDAEVWIAEGPLEDGAEVMRITFRSGEAPDPGESGQALVTLTIGFGDRGRTPKGAFQILEFVEGVIEDLAAVFPGAP